LRRRKKEAQGFRTIEEEGKRITGLFPNSSQEINEAESNSRFSEDFDSNLKSKLR